jgi:hypothetical protein
VASSEPPRVGSRSGWFWTKLASWIALGYYAFGMTVLLVGYWSEGDKLSRGMPTDTFSPFIWTEVTSWPSSSFVAHWNGYPERFDQAIGQSAVNDSVPSHIWAVVVQAILLFLIVQALGVAVRLARSGRKLAGSDR